MTTAEQPRALDGVRVVELGSLIAGPFATRILADFGAEVIKVESPSSPDPMREWGRIRVDGRALWWTVHSRNKNLVAIDMKAAEGRAVVRELLDRADVLIENMRPGTLERLGLAPELLWESNPGLIIARVSGYGQTGSKSGLPGYASVAEAAGGLRHLNGYPGQPPPRTGISLGDSLASLYAVQGILMALFWRDARGGTGQLVDVSLVESCFSLLESAVPDYAATGYVPQPSGSTLTGIAPSNIYRSRDGRWVVIAANQDTVFARLCGAMGRPDLAEDPRYAGHVQRGENQEELDALIGEWAVGLDSAEINRLLDEAGVPTSAVNDISAIFEDPVFREREMLVPVPDEALGSVMHPGVVPKLSETPGRIVWGGRGVGVDTDATLSKVLGMDDDARDELRRRKVIR